MKPVDGVQRLPIKGYSIQQGRPHGALVFDRSRERTPLTA
jgi:hypothetical protein